MVCAVLLSTNKRHEQKYLVYLINVLLLLPLTPCGVFGVPSELWVFGL